MSERRASWLALAVIGVTGLLLGVVFVNEWVRVVVVTVVFVGCMVPLTWWTYSGIRDALLRWGKPVDDSYRDWEAW